MCFPTWTAVVVAIVSLVVPSGLLASCSAVDCSKTGNDATFVGRLTAIRPGAAEFTVETVTIEQGFSPAHVPVAGTSITAAYADGQERFLRVGDRYQVSEAWIGGGFASGVHVASDACSGGTVHADGSRIDTSSVTGKRARHLAIALVLAPVGALIILAAWLFVRRRGRRSTPST